MLHKAYPPPNFLTLPHMPCQLQRQLQFYLSFSANGFFPPTVYEVDELVWAFLFCTCRKDLSRMGASRHRFDIFSPIRFPVWDLKGFFLSGTAGCCVLAPGVPPACTSGSPAIVHRFPCQDEKKFPLKRLLKTFFVIMQLSQVKVRVI